MSTLEFRNVVKEYTLRGGWRGSTLTAVNDVSFRLDSGKTIALVGQSGSGKSTIAKLLMQMERPTSGEILLDGQPIRRHGSGLRAYRRHVQMVFQDPFASLNPFHSIGHHLARPLLLHKKARTRQELRESVLGLLERVQLTPAESYIDRRPHELSGGQRQRVAIARALAPEPSILVADEPVSMLDVSIRLGVLNLLASLQREEDLGVLYITHDLATARHFSDEILVMFKGSIVEHGPADDVILNPQHEYTKLLAEAAPNPEKRVHA
ncbi:ATP-binding cassette domain-containing protein [Microbacterium sp. STN6]|uniref:ABC transporter ATP-binding protein n=1 Tax=Microbacterium sp. STN6 TaxID=2995588 RepID=UPI002260D00E|nr:ATP-binding cassette domain-containing protein [Microbacterium sp. STN6]MCX7522482.1 ATP-binding cassette domain-containing protein [Microbacterium sp. STN6]